MKSFEELFKEQFGDFLFKEKPRGAVKANQNACTGAFDVEAYQNGERLERYQANRERAASSSGPVRRVQSEDGTK